MHGSSGDAPAPVGRPHRVLGVSPLDHRVRPAAGEPQGALVMLHGRGADEHDLYEFLPVRLPEPPEPEPHS